MSLWKTTWGKTQSRKQHTWEASDNYAKHRCTHKINNHQETLMVFINFAIRDALTFLSYVRIFVYSSLHNMSPCSIQTSIKPMHSKSQIVPVNLTAQCNPSWKLLMGLYSSTMGRVEMKLEILLHWTLYQNCLLHESHHNFVPREWRLGFQWVCAVRLAYNTFPGSGSDCWYGVCFSIKLLVQRRR